jgi:hypothetical protein
MDRISNSISSYLVSAITSFRNPNQDEFQWTTTSYFDQKPVSLTRRVVAETGFIVMIPVGIIESCLSALVWGVAKCLPLSEKRVCVVKQWSTSALFSIAWSAVNTFTNLVCQDLVAHEKVAKRCLSARSIFRIPQGALA